MKTWRLKLFTVTLTLPDGGARITYVLKAKTIASAITAATHHKEKRHPALRGKLSVWWEMTFPGRPPADWHVNDLTREEPKQERAEVPLGHSLAGDRKPPTPKVVDHWDLVAESATRIALEVDFSEAIRNTLEIEGMAKTDAIHARVMNAAITVARNEVMHADLWERLEWRDLCDSAARLITQGQDPRANVAALIREAYE